MPRHYVRKTTPTYKIEDLRRAIQDVRSKQLTLGKAAIKYSVPKTTLHKQVKQEVFKKPKKGRYTVFNKNQEDQLEKYILDCCESFYGITPKSLRKIAFTFAEANKLKHSFNKDLQLAGKDWYYSFMSRHPSISLRTPEATSINRITAFNTTEVKMFFDQLESLQTKHNFSSHRIFNIDETGISTVQKNSKILAPRGLKQVAKATSGERGVTTTAVCAVSANGIYVPPMFIFKRKRMSELLLKGCNTDMIATVSDSGWINESIFVDYLQHFISFVKPTKEEPVLIVLDNHESHISLGAYKLYRENNLHVLSLPPHVSHKMQPLDLTFFSSLKMAYNRECELYMANHPGKRITQYEVGELFTNAYNKTANISKAVSGFRVSGIHPMNPDNFKECFENMLSDEHNISQTLDSSTFMRETPAEQSVSERSEPIDNQSQNAAASDLTNQTVMEMALDTTPPTVPVLLSEITNVPVIPKTTISKRRNKKHSQILSSTPIKYQLEEKEKRQVERKIKKEKFVTKKNTKTAKKKSQLKRKEVRNLKKVFEGNENEEEYFCIFCGEKYESPPTEDWIMCVICNNWAHDKCTSGQCSRGYVCDLCQTK